MTGVVRGRLVLEHGVAPGRLRLEDGRIAAIELDEPEASGPYVLPGFVDIHVHGYGGHDAMGSVDDLDGLARALLRRGVTSFLPTAVTASLGTLQAFAERVRAWMPNAPSDGAEPLGFNLEGPFINPARAGAQNPAFIPSAAPQDPGATFRPLLDGLRIMTVAPEVPGGLDLIRWLASSGVVASLGHSEATLEEARAGYAAGARSTTHLFNAMSGAAHHAPGLAAAALAADDAWVELIADGEHVDPSLWLTIARTKPPDRLVLVSDSLSPAGTGDGRGVVGGLDVELAGDRLTLAGTDTLAGGAIALDAAVRNLVRAGVPVHVASAAASRNPLGLLGHADRGRIAVGQRDDLVALDDDLRVVRVARAGEWIEPR